MEKRYQVFVSSTFIDLQEARQEIMQALLEQDCIPSGMELFPAADEDQWTLIQRVIDDCDYYVIVLGGRYGSIGPDGFSYTEMEYRYATQIGKPVIGFVHADPGSLPSKDCESTEEGRVKLRQFSDLIKKKMCKHWLTPTELGSKVSRSLIQLIKQKPAVGWVRGDLVPSESAAQEILSLRRKLEELEDQIQSSNQSEPEGISELAQGDDPFILAYTFHAAHEWESPWDISERASLTWNEIFAGIAPKLMTEIGSAGLWKAMNSFLQSFLTPQLEKTSQLRDRLLSNFQISQNDFETIMIQLRALGLIIRTDITANGSFINWTLTPYGDRLMTRLRAQRR